MSKFDTLLKIGSAFNWISPVKASIDDLRNGQNHTFYIHENCGWSLNQIALILRRHGIKTWGHMIVNGDIMITVQKQHTDWARYLLRQEGLPIHYG